MKAIIAAAGFGSRMLPITKTIPKEMLPVGNKPVIQYIVEALSKTGINDIIIVTSTGKSVLEDYFDKNTELELLLERKGKSQLLSEVNNTKELANICYVRQKEQKGFGHALLPATNYISEDYFFLTVGDSIFSSQIFVDMMEIHIKTGSSVVALQQIDMSKVENYGVVDIVDNKIVSIVERPKIEEAPSNLIILGAYILPKKIFDIIDKLELDPILGEILLTDAIEALAKEQDILPYITDHPVWDVGNIDGFLKANEDFGKNRIK